MAAYRRVTEIDRVIIKAYREAGSSLKGIAEQVGFNKSTISRELNRNRFTEVSGNETPQ
jgi:IS30 family transposase